jgi:hypothetical protein
MGQPAVLLTRPLCCWFAWRSRDAWGKVECSAWNGDIDTRSTAINGPVIVEHRGRFRVGTTEERVAIPLLITAGRASNEILDSREYDCAVG